MAPNQFTYNALISVLTFSGHLDLATEKFREMAEVNENRWQQPTTNMKYILVQPIPGQYHNESERERQ